MKHKKGFTLVELLVVIALIGLVIAIIIPSIIFTVNRIKEKTYQGKLDIIKSAAEAFGSDNREKLFGMSTSCVYITAKDLIDSGYLSTDKVGTIEDPRGKIRQGLDGLKYKLVNISKSKITAELDLLGSTNEINELLAEQQNKETLNEITTLKNKLPTVKQELINLEKDYAATPEGEAKENLSDKITEKKHEITEIEKKIIDLEFDNQNIINKTKEQLKSMIEEAELIKESKEKGELEVDIASWGEFESALTKGKNIYNANKPASENMKAIIDIQSTYTKISSCRDATRAVTEVTNNLIAPVETSNAHEGFGEFSTFRVNFQLGKKQKDKLYAADVKKHICYYGEGSNLPESKINDKGKFIDNGDEETGSCEFSVISPGVYTYQICALSKSGEYKCTTPKTKELYDGVDEEDCDTGSVVRYANKDWTVIAKNTNGTCRLILNKPETSGSYSAQLTNLNTWLNSSNNKQLQLERDYGGLVLNSEGYYLTTNTGYTTLNSNYPSNGIKNPWWTGSGTIRNSAKVNTYSTATTHFAYNMKNNNTALTSALKTTLKTTAKPDITSGVSNTATTYTYPTASYTKSTTSAYYGPRVKRFSFIITGSTASRVATNWTEYTVNASGSRTKNNDGSIKSTKSYNWYICGSTTTTTTATSSGCYYNSSTSTKKNCKAHGNRIYVTALSDKQFYYTNYWTGAGDPNSKWTGTTRKKYSYNVDPRRYFEFAAGDLASTVDDVTRTYKFNSGTCAKRTQYTPTNVAATIYYRPAVIVRMR